MSTTKTWHVDLFIGERDGLTHAEARLRPDETVTLTGTGTARLNPTDRDVPEIGDELAVARALSDLAHRLLHAAAEDIESLTHERVHISR
ncbi:DUF1876 domain-containing protein [Nocardioides sp. WL0053]|jgi:uncharacterized protein DUF1876|uniref:DUF1876 domain-containing protein n=1 Tax=Nocardioides jiangsuensis TaxID=2866161 RepID=A0ABS7RJ60_9ACTN|nr:DUF1876 domain-containing protein [Nocardioides jiangsuensis]MBY9074108.1 DUF1876 domain-containing protein [Nocardioides jiangsuensis]